VVDFANANLCGASPELNDVLSKLEDAKADITAKLDASASAASAAFGEAKNELEGLKNKLQTIEIPAIPKLNLQAEIASLTSLVPGTPSFLSALAKVKLEFEDDIKGAGLDLGTLVADATTAITGGGDLCALVPNLEKTSGSLGAATTKPAAVTQAAAKAISEPPSVVRQNVAVEKKVVRLKAKKLSYEVTNTPPTEDTGAFIRATGENTKNISNESGSKTKVTLPGNGANLAAAESAGWVHIQGQITKLVKFEDLQISGSNITFNNLKYKPSSIYKIEIFPPENVRDKMLITARDPNLFRVRKFATKEEYKSINRLWRNEKKPPYYDGQQGQHMIDLRDYRGVYTNVNQKTLINDKSITINSPVIPEGNHPGNLNSVEEIRFLRNGGIFRIEVSNRGRFKNNKGYARSERVLNKEFKGYAARITYRYNEKYRAEVEPESAADIAEREADAAADAKRWKDEDAADRARWKKEAEEEAYGRSPEGIAAREAEFARQDAEEELIKQDLADYLKTPEGQAEVLEFGEENVTPSEQFLDSRGRTY
jgi:hypothetical protein